MNPSSTSFKTTSYTIPVGKWANISVIPTVFTTESRSSGTVAVNKWQINSTTVFAGNHTTHTDTTGTSGSYTMPTECSSFVSYEGGHSTSTSQISGAITYNQKIAVFRNDTGTNITSNDNRRTCIVSCNAGTISSNNAQFSLYFSSAIHEKEAPSFSVYAGDVISGVGSYRWFVIEYDL